MAPPLARYIRPAAIEAAIDAILETSRDDIRRRLQIGDSRNANYLSPEVVLFLIRRSRDDNADRWFDVLYTALTARLARALPRGEDVRSEDVARRVTRRFVDLLIADRRQASDGLDFFECRFEAGVAKLRADAKRAVYVRGPKFEPLFEDDAEQVSSKVASAIERHLQSTLHPFDDENFRSELLTAIEELPENERRTATLMLQGLHDHDQDPTVATISSELHRSARMIQTYRRDAARKLRQILVEDDQ